MGHLSKTTTEYYVIDELTELLSPSSTNDLSEIKKGKSILDNSKMNQNIIVDCQVKYSNTSWKEVGCQMVKYLNAILNTVQPDHWVP